MGYTRLAFAHKGKIKRDADTFTMQTIDICSRIATISLINDSAHTDVATLAEDILHLQHAIASTVPVVVFHLTSVHWDNTWSTIHSLVQVYLSVLQSNHNAGGLEGGAGFPKVAHGIVLHLVVFPIRPASQVDDSLDVARLDFHHDGNAYLSVDSFFLQLTA